MSLDKVGVFLTLILLYKEQSFSHLWLTFPERSFTHSSICEGIYAALTCHLPRVAAAMCSRTEIGIDSNSFQHTCLRWTGHSIAETETHMISQKVHWDPKGYTWCFKGIYAMPCYNVCTEVRGQTVGVPLFWHVGFGNLTHAARIGGKHPYLLSHLIDLCWV